MPIDHKVEPGDCISSIAHKYGMVPDTIWNDPANAELKSKRKTPNVLMAGDIVIIKDLEKKEVACSTGGRHRFNKKKGTSSVLKLVIEDEEMKPRANVKYVLTVGGSITTGATDGDGKINHPIPPNARSGHLAVGDAAKGEDLQEYDLVFGELDPIDTMTGVQQRLRNLGFYHGAIDGKSGPHTKEAISNYQAAHDIKATGKPDDSTRRKMQEEHGG